MVLGSELECLSRKKEVGDWGAGAIRVVGITTEITERLCMKIGGVGKLRWGRNRTSGDLRMDLKGSLVRRGEVEHEEKKRWKGLSGGMGREGEAKLGDRQGRIRNG